MPSIKTLSTKSGKALRDFDMIHDGDKILIGYSGGKDSYALIKVLDFLKTKYNINCEFKIITIDPGFDKSFQTNIKNSLKNIKIPFEIIPTKINEVIDKKTNDGKDLCFFCARLRRGLLYKYAKENNYDTIALGHNLDDAIETFLMNMFYSNQISALKPTYVSEEHKIKIIRPQIYIDQDLIVDYIKKENFRPVKNNCPLKEADSKRLYFRKMIQELKLKDSQIKNSACKAFQNTKNSNFWDK